MVNANRQEVVTETLEAVVEKGSVQTEYFKKYCDYVQELISKIDFNSVRRVVDCFLQARDHDKTIYFAGNGGSAATASHFAQDMGEVGRKIKGRGFRTVGLNDNVSAVTAISNDYGYEQVFLLQIENNFDAGDVLVVISASGNSPNVVKAVELAKQKGGTTVGLVGFDGGRLAQICERVVHVKSDKGAYGPVEDIHLVLNHMIVAYLILELKKGSQSGKELHRAK